MRLANPMALWRRVFLPTLSRRCEAVALPCACNPVKGEGSDEVIINAHHAIALKVIHPKKYYEVNSGEEAEGKSQGWGMNSNPWVATIPKFTHYMSWLQPNLRLPKNCASTLWPIALVGPM